MGNLELKMKNEVKKEYLNSYKQAVIAAKCMEEELYQLKLAKRCPTVFLDGMPHTRNGTGDLSGYAAKVDEAEQKLQSERYKRITLFTEIISKVEQMEDEMEKNLLRLKYIHLKTWEEVCEDMSYSLQHIHRLHTKALSDFTM